MGWRCFSGGEGIYVGVGMSGWTRIPSRRSRGSTRVCWRGWSIWTCRGSLPEQINAWDAVVQPRKASWSI